MGKPRQLEFIGKVSKRELQRETTSVESPPKSQVFQLSTDPQCARPEREPPERTGESSWTASKMKAHLRMVVTHLK